VGFDSQAQPGINTAQEKQSLALLPLEVKTKQVVVLGMAQRLPSDKIEYQLPARWLDIERSGVCSH